jgi:CdiI immunity protein
MTEKPAHGRKPFDRADYPALREFFPAYLHQDFAEEYGSAVRAVEGFVDDASGDEILQVKEEWKMFRNAMLGLPFDELQKALVELGSAWRPAKEQELEELDKTLSRAEA